MRTSGRKEGTSLLHMKIASILMIVLMLASAVPAAFAATAGTAAVDGNPPATLEITITGDKSAWSLAVGDNEDTTSVDMNVKSNVAWEVKVSDKLDGSKPAGTVGEMAEYNSTSSAYIASGEVLANAIQVKAGGGDYVALSGTDQKITEAAATASTDFDIGLKQTIGYGDKRLVTANYVYRIVVTFTVSSTV